jgi:tetratricopeptide (TPR) repeat protein
VNGGKVIGILLLLPLMAMIFLNHSLRVFSADHYFMEGTASFKAQDYRTAETYFGQALDDYPQDKSSLYSLGISQFFLEKLPESKKTLLKLIQLDPNYFQSHYWLANNYFRTGEFEKAKAEYQEDLRINHTYRPSYYDLGLIAVRENDIEKSLEYFERVHTLEGDPTTGHLRLDALRNLMEINQQLGNQEKVEMYGEKLRQLGG